MKTVSSRLFLLLKTNLQMTLAGYKLNSTRIYGDGGRPGIVGGTAGIDDSKGVHKDVFETTGIHVGPAADMLNADNSCYQWLVAWFQACPGASRLYTIAMKVAN